MAFDLNKNEGTKIAPTKFDLSKGEVETTGPKLKTWLIGLITVATVGGGIWYYSSPGNPSSTTQVAIPDSPQKDSISGSTSNASADTVNEKNSANRLSSSESEMGTNTEAPVVDHITKDNTDVEVLNYSIPVTFVKGSIDFASSNKALIKRITEYLSQNPDKSVEVNGYASSEGSLSANQQISKARADAFKQYLITMDVVESRIITNGKGIMNPVASNKTSSGRQKNRRVEVVFP